MDLKRQNGIALYPSASEQIMERLMRLDPGACVRMRDTFAPGPNRWYVSPGRVAVTSTNGNGLYFPGQSGDSPESAIIKTWEEIMEIARNPEKFFLRYNCAGNVPIPGDDPRAWVRWSETKDDWEDVEPTAEQLAVHGTPADRVHSYAEQRRIDRRQ